MGSTRSFVNGSTPTVLLVHGAFSDASVWSEVSWQLQAAGLDVAAPANPLRGGIVDGAGVVIDRAAEQVDNVVGLAMWLPSPSTRARR